ncbi:AraC family transcriptional regulator [bacterium]|nr:AraC family transcriptional regulator [bacterium]
MKTLSAEPPRPLPGNDDFLGNALHHLRMQTALYCRSELTAPWSIDMPVMENILMIHVVLSGQFWLEMEGVEPQLIRAGQLALVAHGDGHRLSSETGLQSREFFSLPVEKVNESYEILRHGGGGEETHLVCGVASFGDLIAKQFFSALPPFIHLDTTDSPQGAWMQSTMNQMAYEAGAMRPGGETMVTLLADLLVIQAIRSWLNSPTHQTTGWLAAMHDPAIGRALELIHTNPGHPWTVSELAVEAGKSRSGFAARFSELLRMTPFEYINEWRMGIATNLLKEDHLSLHDIAERCGYTSEAAFSRAYKRQTGSTPRQVTRNKHYVHSLAEAIPEEHSS